MIELAAIFIVAITFWFVICSDRAFRQRMKVIDSTFGKSTYDEKVAIFDSLKRVSLNRHTWFLFTFRDPKNLYVEN
jgi:hypothetical protein